MIEHSIHPAYGPMAEGYAGCNPSDLIITGRKRIDASKM